MNTDTLALHNQLRLLCRWALGFVWIWEGLVTKLLWPTPMQRETVVASGLYWPNPDTFIQGLGVAMLIAGIILCIGWRERLAVLVATASMGILIVLVVAARPASLFDMHGGIPKDACLIACAWVVWKLSPQAKRARNPQDQETEERAE